MSLDPRKLGATTPEAELPVIVHAADPKGNAPLTGAEAWKDLQSGDHREDFGRIWSELVLEPARTRAREDSEIQRFRWVKPETSLTNAPQVLLDLDRDGRSAAKPTAAQSAASRLPSAVLTTGDPGLPIFTQMARMDRVEKTQGALARLASADTNLEDVQRGKGWLDVTRLMEERAKKSGYSPAVVMRCLREERAFAQQALKRIFAADGNPKTAQQKVDSVAQDLFFRGYRLPIGSQKADGGYDAKKIETFIQGINQSLNSPGSNEVPSAADLAVRFQNPSVLFQGREEGCSSAFPQSQARAMGIMVRELQAGRADSFQGAVRTARPGLEADLSSLLPDYPEFTKARAKGIESSTASTLENSQLSMVAANSEGVAPITTKVGAMTMMDLQTDRGLEFAINLAQIAKDSPELLREMARKHLVEQADKEPMVGAYLSNAGDLFQSSTDADWQEASGRVHESFRTLEEHMPETAALAAVVGFGPAGLMLLPSPRVSLVESNEGSQIARSIPSDPNYDPALISAKTFVVGATAGLTVAQISNSGTDIRVYGDPHGAGGKAVEIYKGSLADAPFGDNEKTALQKLSRKNLNNASLVIEAAEKGIRPLNPQPFVQRFRKSFDPLEMMPPVSVAS
jgi:hypothetical protein